MTIRNKNTTLWSLALLALVGGAAAAPPAPRAQKAKEPIDFDRDVRVILSENCFACHGFDEKKRQANLRLDTAQGAYLRRPSGKTPVAPGKPEKSDLLERVLRKDALQMPPASTGKKLTQKQIAILRQWISEGGKYQDHWAFVTPKRPAPPALKNVLWSRNAIDQYILARLEKEGLTPSPEADRRTLARRLSLDLRGLPPSIGEVEAFLQDRRPNAYERLVDRFLADAHYGERMALQWLDLSRYADTHGYHIDSHRDMWRWREWVIDSFNKNLPYDKFLLYQIAGDLLPNPTLEQKIATGFSRNHPINFEGGAIPEEYQTAYVADRVDTTATAVLGLSLRCGQCHNHKYDPITQKEYYRFYAYFNNISEVGLDGTRGNAIPFLKAPSKEQETQLAALNQQTEAFAKDLQARIQESKPAQQAWERSEAPKLLQSGGAARGVRAHYAFEETSGDLNAQNSVDNLPAKSVGATKRAPGKVGFALELDGVSYVDCGDAMRFDRNNRVSYGAWLFPTAGGAMVPISRMDEANAVRGWDIFVGDGRVYVHLIHKWEDNAIRVNTTSAIPMNQWSHVFVTYDGSSKAKGVRIYINGKPQPLSITHDSLTETLLTEKPAHIGRRSQGGGWKGRIDEVRFYPRELSAAEVQNLVALDSVRPALAIAPEKRTPEQNKALEQFYLENYDAEYQKINAQYAAAKNKRDSLDAAIPTTMVMQEMEPNKARETFVLVRGEYDKKSEKVTAGTPAALPPPPPNAPQNRLGLAQWLIAPNHPLTARVAINHFWQLFFGVGLVKTAEDFGIQGERPSHPELLDWLATEFVRSGWDVKHMTRLIVTSAAYRQSSKVSKALYAHDPENRLIARASRFRLPAELLRDMALETSGLLVKKIGGPSVLPYHPKGLWEEMAFGGEFSAQTYVQGKGEDLYRRGMYTFWKRTCPPPSLQTLDAPEREFCIVRRSVTNTPLQALILMNDPTYVEAARKFAERLMTQGGSSQKQRLQYAYQIALSRYATPKEMEALLKALGAQREIFQKNPAAAEKLLAVGESQRNPKLDAAELAAWTLVASVLLNMDEAITRG